MKGKVALILAVIMLFSALGISGAAEDRFFEGGDVVMTSTVIDTKRISGLDDIVGVTSNTTVTIPVLEDTYVEGGNSQNSNFGSLDMMDFKALAVDDPDNPLKWASLHRIPLVKFDISSLNKDDARSVVLTLECYMHQTPGVYTTVNVYGCDPLTWSENTVTYNKRPEHDIPVSTAVVTGKGLVYLDVTDYVLECLKYGDKEVAFILEGDGSPEAVAAGSVQRLHFRTKESKEGVAPYLSVTCGKYGFSTDFTYEGENPWKLAMRTVSDWMRKWERIKNGGDPDTETLVQRESEYTVLVDTAQLASTNGADTKYYQAQTRLLSTLDDYTPDFSEGDKLDVYGGLMDESLKQEATGFFYTKKIGDRWWTIDPLGYPFYRTAVVNVNAGYSSAQATKFLNKYGSVKKWAQSATDRLRELGFNSTGNWSNIDGLSNVNDPLSQTQRWNIIANYMTQTKYELDRYGENSHIREDILPVFDPGFLPSAMKSVETATKGYAGSSLVYGWFSDNEQPVNIKTLDYSLKKDPTNPAYMYSYTTAWTFMYMKTGNINVTRGDVTDELRNEYIAMVYDRYFSVAKLCRDKYVPRHQYIGCRFANDGVANEYVIRVAGQYCDVISYNWYGAWSAKPSTAENIQKWAGKPFIITEWYAKGMDVWEKDNRFTNKDGAGFTVKNQADRAKFYQNFSLSLLECKGCVGFDWFEYMDNDPATTPDLSNKGMLDCNGEEYTELTSAMQEVNTQKYNLVRFFDERNHK